MLYELVWQTEQKSLLMPSAPITIQSPETESTISLAASVESTCPGHAVPEGEEAQTSMAGAPDEVTRLLSLMRRAVKAMLDLRVRRAVRCGVTHLPVGQ